jgi:hypothetical protein
MVGRGSADTTWGMVVAGGNGSKKAISIIMEID